MNHAFPKPKKMKCGAVLALSALCAATAPALRAAGTPETPKGPAPTGTRSAFSVLDDNDFFGRWSDKYYTNHTRLSFTLGADGTDSVNHSYFFSLGQEIYSPKDREATVPDPRDHPYAGYLYASAGYALFDDDLAILQETQLGVTGDWSLADKVQCEYHRLIDEVRPAGWETQIHNRVVVQAIGEIRKRIMLDGACGNEAYGADVILHGSGGLGNLRGTVSAGAEIRAGWNLPKDFDAADMRRSASVTFDPQVSRSIYGFLDLQADAVLWDKTLTGNNGSGADITAYPFVGQAMLGIGIVYDRFMLTVFQAARTRDFTSQDKDFFAYGGFRLSVFF